MSAPGTIVWFARHEFRLAWRDWVSMMTAGRRARVRTLAVVFTILALVMHAVAFVVVSRFAASTPDKTTLVVITGSMLMMWSLMLSHAMEQVARAFYARSDLELLLSSPADARTIFSVRLGAIATSVMTTAVLTGAPFINVLAATGGARRLTAYAAVLAIGAVAAAAATILTAAMFEMVGPKRTRLIAQIAAAVIGAGLVIALQFAVIASTGTISRVALLASEPIVARAPDVGSIVWWPARAVLGDVSALAIVLGASLVVLGASIAAVAPRFAGSVTAAAGVAQAAARPSRREWGFRTASPIATLRRKECGCFCATRGWCRKRSCSCFICCRRHSCCGAVLAAIPAPKSCWCRCWSWRPDSSRVGSPGSPFRPRTRPTSSRRRRSFPGRFCAPRSTPSWA
jgi:ABC-2 type transport system permease protein